MTEKLRVFVSYAHDDSTVIRAIIQALKDNGLEPISDEHIRAGRGFHEDIKTYIAHAHVFMPVITAASSDRGWVHQEIGYALGLNVPVIPACIGHLPHALVEGLQAIVLHSDSSLQERLPASLFDAAVRDAKAPAPYVCAPLPDDRARLIAEFARSVRQIGKYGHVCQLGGLSSFHIPNRPITNVEWRLRYGVETRSADHCKLLRAEREALLEHAMIEGCSLIVNPNLSFEPLGPGVRSIRIWELIQFLESMADDKVRIVFDRTLENQSVHIVGDWFLAESVAADVRIGYSQTIFTRHAPTVRQRILDFDEYFADLLRDPDNACCRSRTSAIDALKNLPGISSARPAFMGSD